MTRAPVYYTYSTMTSKSFYSKSENTYHITTDGGSESKLHWTTDYWLISDWSDGLWMCIYISIRQPDHKANVIKFIVLSCHQRGTKKVYPLSDWQVFVPRLGVLASSNRIERSYQTLTGLGIFAWLAVVQCTTKKMMRKYFLHWWIGLQGNSRNQD